MYRPSARIRSAWRHRCERILICARAFKACQRGWDRKLVNSAGLTPIFPDAYIDRVIEKDIFEERKKALLMERKDLEEKITHLKENSRSIPDRLTEFLELAGSAYLSYKMGIPEEKRDLLRIVTSNREADGKNLDLRLSLPFDEVANRFQNSYGGPYRDIPRTWDVLLPKLLTFFKTNPIPIRRPS